MKKLSLLIITMLICVNLFAGCAFSRKFDNFELISGTYDLPVEVSDKQMNKIVKVLNSYSFEEKEKTNEEHLEEDCFEITYTKDGLLYKWGIRKTTTSLYVFKNKELEYQYITIDTQLLDEVCKIVYKLSYKEKEWVDLLFTGYAKLQDSQGVDIAEEFVNQYQEKYDQQELKLIYDEMMKYTPFVIYSDGKKPIKFHDNIGAQEEYESFEALIELKLEAFYFDGKKIDFYDENDNILTFEIKDMKDEYIKDKQAVIEKVARMVVSISE